MKFVFVGGGNMAAALIGGWLKSGGHASDIAVVEVGATRREELKRQFGVTVYAQPEASLSRAQIFVLAVKPQHMREACAALKPCVGESTVLSIAAGIRTSELARLLGTDRLVRCMPNTPALIGQGISGAIARPRVDADARALVERLLQSAGPVIWFDDEAKLDTVTALSGSGPAYIFYVIEAMIQAAVELGLSDTQARQLAVQTVIGAGHLAAQSDEPVSLLRDRVTSKGGTTAAGLQALAQDHAKEAIVRAIHAAHRRAIELGDEFERNAP